MNLSALLLEPQYISGYPEVISYLTSDQSNSRSSHDRFAKHGGSANVAIQSSVLKRIAIVEPAKPYLLSCLRRDLGRPILVVTSTGSKAQQLAEQLPVWGPAAQFLYAEAEELVYERNAVDPESRRDRLHVLSSLARQQADGIPQLIIASVRALSKKIMPRERFAQASRVLKTGDVINVRSLLLHLLDNGYRSELVVDEAGTFARRGGIIDIFSPAERFPIRLELLGDEIDTIREFDPSTQRSGNQLTSALITPARDTLCTALERTSAVAQLDLSTLRPEVNEKWSLDFAAIGEGDSSANLAFYDSVCCQSTLADYLPPNAIVVFDEPHSIISTFRELGEQAQQQRRELIDLGELPPNFPRPYFTWEELSANLSPFRAVEISWLSSAADAISDAESDAEAAYSADRPNGANDTAGTLSAFRSLSSYGGRIKLLVDDISAAQRDNGRVVLITPQSQRLRELLAERGIPSMLTQEVLEDLPGGSVAIIHGDLREGFSLVSPDPARSFTLLSDTEMFGWSKPRRALARKAVQRDLFVSDLEPGALVVHVEHGVGRFQGLTHIDNEGVDREYIIIDYAEGDRLLVPVDQLDRITRYVGVGDQAPRLHRLGSGDWQRQKARVKAAVRDIARDLLDIYAAREVKQGFAFSPDSLWQRELEDSFPYAETADQMKAIAETKADMERPKPMDRLICGDVGYGKTEVALRAAFKAVMDGKQVAMLVPTTVLAQQHFETFRERMGTFPVRVEMLSRFRTEKEQLEVLSGLQAGAVDICIGTHRLIQKDVSFKDLGLVIIDEEQRFGVVHKERLKQLRKEVDVLTLTATPIPRTLYLGLSSVRDMSTMETAPEDRLPIKTYVTEYEPRLVREAILRELDRGGQVYFVHNRVQSIALWAQRLAELVPEALIEVGHGQMPEDRLEKVMVDFAAGKFDVLVCTTIIESGIDIPNVNTIIINQADRFGLSQLYQLRGRVGRAANRAYAYFLFSRDKQLTATAEKRLRTIFEATELGSGFKIAMRDLEIRGAGNLLGTEQHGHVAAVGFDLYCRLLAEAVAELRGNAEPRAPEVTIILPITAHLPESYIPEAALRINLYQRMADAQNADDVGKLVLELRDRFGAPPEPVLNLAFLLQLKLAAGKAGVTRIESVDHEIVIIMRAGLLLPREELAKEFGPGLQVGHTQLRLHYNRAHGNWLPTVSRVIEALSAHQTR